MTVPSITSLHLKVLDKRKDICPLLDVFVTWAVSSQGNDRNILLEGRDGEWRPRSGKDQGYRVRG